MTKKLIKWPIVSAFFLMFSIGDIAGSPPDSLTILITGALRGRLNGCNCPSANRGGIARRAVLMRQLFEQSEPLGVDCGQLLDLDPDGGRMRSACAILSLGRMGTAVSLVATRDLYYGINFISQVADSADIELVCANIVDGLNGGLIFSKWVELEHNGVKLAFTGLTQHFPHRRIPGIDSWRTVNIDSALVHVKAAIPSNSDLIILLTDLSESKLNQLIPSFPELDIVLTSSRRIYSTSPIVVNSTVIIRPQPDGSYLEGLVIPIGQKKVTKGRLISHPINSQIQPDGAYNKWLENCQKADFPLN